MIYKKILVWIVLIVICCGMLLYHSENTQKRRIHWLLDELQSGRLYRGVNYWYVHLKPTCEDYRYAADESAYGRAIYTCSSESIMLILYWHKVPGKDATYHSAHLVTAGAKYATDEDVWFFWDDELLQKHYELSRSIEVLREPPVKEVPESPSDGATQKSQIVPGGNGE